MAGRVSALAVLGLDPGADGAAIEQAYKRLIKQHHPDRAGGDASRAAEITRAYRELRGGNAATDPLEFNEEFRAKRKQQHWPLAALVAGGAMSALVLALGPSAPLTRSASAARAGLAVRHVPQPAGAEPMDAPLHLRAIDGAVQQALQLYRTKDEMALASVSRGCHRRLRDDPNTMRLDRCAAFDDAVIGLEDRDPLRDEGPFAPLAVTGRQWSAASALSDDYLAIDGRLDQIRLRVEMALAPQVPPVAPPVAQPQAAPPSGD
jgi:DnaJ domain